MDAIGKTSLLTAAMRARESARTEAEGRLFDDPFADLLAGAEGKAILEQALIESGDQPAIAVRTKYMDDKIIRAVQGGVRQMVLIAAGMDSRAYRMNLPKEMCIFELDRPEVLTYKQKVLRDFNPKCELRLVPVDLTGDWSSELAKAKFNPKQNTLWMVEGLLMYLKKPDVDSLFKKINATSKSGDALLLDVLSQTLIHAPFMKKQLEFLERMGAPWHFGLDEPEAYLSALGWRSQSTHPAEYVPSRWPFPAPPRNAPNVPRSFFIEARKI